MTLYLLVLAPALAVTGDTGLAREVVTASGADRFDEVHEVRFTFEVERDGEVAAHREWAWRPADGRVTRTVDGVDLSFTFGAPTSDAEQEADAQFVNDSFWFLPPLHVSWAGDDLEVVDGGEVPLPIGEGTAHRVTLRYDSTGGGYTPGDAYDLYLGDDGRIAAWSYHRGGAEAPTLTTTFEGYVQAGPLHVATVHRSADGSFLLRTTDVAVTTAP